MSRKRKLVVTVNSNRVTCGDCRFLRKIKLSTVIHQEEWWCNLFNESRGWVGAMKTPNRSDSCRKAEKDNQA